MKTADLQGAALDYWVSRAEGSLAVNLKIGKAPTTGDRIVCIENDPSGFAWMVFAPSTDWKQGGPLIDKYGLTVEPYPPAWWANEPDETAVMGEDPLQAICRAVVRAAFGDEVEEVSP